MKKKQESASIISMMCKKGFLQLDPADVKEIVRGNQKRTIVLRNKLVNGKVPL